MKKNLNQLPNLPLTAILIAAFFLTGGYYLLARETNRDQTSSQVNRAPVAANDELTLMRVETVARPLQIEIRGRIRAEHRLEIFPEVQGKILSLSKAFREGIRFERGEIMVRIDDEEARLNLYASRSSFQTLIASLLPDIKLDYPDHLQTVEQWFGSLHPEMSLPELPELHNPQLQRFLSSRGVYNQYYQIKSAKNRLEKFTIRAPFSGVLSSAKADPGQNISPQNHLGTLVDPGSFILTGTIRSAQLDFVQTGDVVKLQGPNRSTDRTAEITRINPSVDPKSQSVEIYIPVSGEGLREGLFLEGVLETDELQSMAEIPKAALLRTGHVYAVREGALRQIPVEVVDLEHRTVWVTGLEDGDRIMADAGKAWSGKIVQ